MAEVKWIKVSTDMFESNRKIKQIELMPEGDTILVIWLKLLLLAGNVNDGGNIYLTPEIPYTDEMLANELRRPLTTVRMALKVFEQYGMIEIIDDILHLSSWEKYQNVERLDEIREYNRLAKQKSRAKKKLLEGVKDNVKDKSMTSQHGHDIEEEKEEDKEKEIHSFNRSCTPEGDFDVEAFIEKRVREEGFEDEESADVFRDEVKEGLKMRYRRGSLGQGAVFMSDEQFNDLLDKLTIDEIDKYFEIVAECEKNGKRYKNKSHYQAILDMVAKDRKIKR